MKATVFYTFPSRWTSWNQWTPDNSMSFSNEEIEEMFLDYCRTWFNSIEGMHYMIVMGEEKSI
jgi:hypothetical protein